MAEVEEELNQLEEELNNVEEEQLDEENGEEGIDLSTVNLEEVAGNKESSWLIVDCVHIWVSFCRTGKIAVLCPFFLLKSRAAV